MYFSLANPITNLVCQIDEKLMMFGKRSKFWSKNKFCCEKFWSKIEIFVKNLNVGQKSNFRSKIQILIKDRNIGQKSKFWSKIKILVKNQNCGQKIEILGKNGNFNQ